MGGVEGISQSRHDIAHNQRSLVACVELIESPMFDVGFYSIGTDVEDLDETLAILKERGCEPIAPIVPTSVGRQTFIQDPNGVRVCLIEHTAEYRAKYMQ